MCIKLWNLLVLLCIVLFGSFRIDRILEWCVEYWNGVFF